MLDHQMRYEQAVLHFYWNHRTTQATESMKENVAPEILQKITPSSLQYLIIMAIKLWHTPNPSLYGSDVTLCVLPTSSEGKLASETNILTP